MVLVSTLSIPMVLAAVVALLLWEVIRWIEDEWLPDVDPADDIPGPHEPDHGAERHHPAAAPEVR